MHFCDELEIYLIFHFFGAQAPTSPHLRMLAIYIQYRQCTGNYGLWIIFLFINYQNYVKQGEDLFYKANTDLIFHQIFRILHIFISIPPIFIYIHKFINIELHRTLKTDTIPSPSPAMILFQLPQIQQQDLQPSYPNRMCIKIGLCIFLRIVIIVFNLFTVNQNPQFLFPAVSSFGVFIIAQLSIFFAYKLGYISIKSKETIQTTTSSQQSSTQLQQQNAQNNKNIKWFPNVFWHLVLFSNIFTTIFAISCTLQSVLSSYLHKIRGMLYFVIFICLLGIAYWVNNPYLHNFWSGKPINYLLILKKYEQAQIGFLKYLYFCYAMGALIDFLLYGTSDIVSFQIRSSMETLNIATVALSWLGFMMAVFVMWIFVMWIKKYQVIQAVKDIINTE